jgi:hypothetical protein
MGPLGSLWDFCAFLGDARSVTKDDGRFLDRDPPNLILLSELSRLQAKRLQEMYKRMS